MNKQSARIMGRIVFLSDTFVFENNCIYIYSTGRVERARSGRD